MTLKPHFSKISFGLILLVLNACHSLKHETVYKGYSVEGVHSRGLQIRDKKVVVTGVNGVYSIYGLDGKQQFLDSIPDVTDFRDVMLFADSSISFMDASESSQFLRRDPEGNVRTVYKRSYSFSDGMDFWDEKNGIAFGDPFSGKFYIMTTVNSGERWAYQSTAEIDLPDQNEVGFAASGSSIQCIGDSTAVFGTGGNTHPRLFITYDRGSTWIKKETPIVGGFTGGIYSLFFWSEQEGVIIGGDYKEPEKNDSICYYTADGGNSWTDISNGLGGYCSSIHGTKDGSLLVATGRVGTYYSLDKGQKWKLLTEDKYYAVRVSDTHIAFSGKNGVFCIMSYEL